jgi:hypothetical protein
MDLERKNPMAYKRAHSRPKENTPRWVIDHNQVRMKALFTGTKKRKPPRKKIKHDTGLERTSCLPDQKKERLPVHVLPLLGCWSK